jgi:Tol biopolymer transport system component
VRSGSGAEREPSLSKNGGIMAFSTGSVDRNIVLQTIAGGTPGQEFGTVGHESMARFTPEAKALVYVSGRTHSENELRVRPLLEGRIADDSLDIPLTKHGEGEVVHPAASRDGRFVAYYRVVNGQRDVWTISSDGGPPERITTDKANDIQPAWSPDGTSLAFASERGGGWDIWKLTVAGGRSDERESQVTRGRNAQAPEWSPDGLEIAYVTEPGSAGEVWVVRTDGVGEPRRVTTGAGAFRVRWPRKDQMVVNGKWGASFLSPRMVNPATGVSTPFNPPLVIGYDEELCDFDVDLDRGLFVFTSGGKRHGNIWILKARR